MASYDAETFMEVFERLSLPDQIGKLADVLGLVRKMPRLAAARPLSEIVRCIEAIDEQDELRTALQPLRAELVERALRGLLTGNPDLPFDLAALNRDALLDILPHLNFSPSLADDQIGPASVDLTLGVPDGKELGSVIEVQKGDLVVLPTLEAHGRWPDGILGRVSVRSGPARRGTECDPATVKHLNSIWIFPGSKGSIHLEILYLGEEPAFWTLGKTRLVQLTFLRILSKSAKAQQPLGHRNGHGNGRAHGLTAETFELEGRW